eukprot:scaffold21570_cov24-Phaeocystis_antarctica.AAC.1
MPPPSAQLSRHVSRRSTANDDTHCAHQRQRGACNCGRVASGGGGGGGALCDGQRWGSVGASGGGPQARG